MIDITKLKKESHGKTKDGKEFVVRNVYLSPEGLMVVAKTSIAGPCDQNFRLEDITEMKTKEEKQAEKKEN